LFCGTYNWHAGILIINQQGFSPVIQDKAEKSHMIKMQNIEQELTVSGENALQIADAINATTLIILKILGQ
jgi:hypothetical protein